MGKEHEALKGQIEVAHYLRWLGGQTAARRQREAESVIRRAQDRIAEVQRDAQEEASALTRQAVWLEQCPPSYVAAYLGIDIGGEKCPACDGAGEIERDTCERCLGVGKIDPFLAG